MLYKRFLDYFLLVPPHLLCNELLFWRFFNYFPGENMRDTKGYTKLAKLQELGRLIHSLPKGVFL